MAILLSERDMKSIVKQVTEGAVTLDAVRDSLRAVDAEGLAEIERRVADAGKGCEGLAGALAAIVAKAKLTVRIVRSDNGKYFLEYGIPGERLGMKAWCAVPIIAAVCENAEFREESLKLVNEIRAAERAAAAKR